MTNFLQLKEISWIVRDLSYLANCAIYKTRSADEGGISSGGIWRRKEKRGVEETGPRVDRIGAPNLGIRICRLICGFHRNCLSTRCPCTHRDHIHLLYISRPVRNTRWFLSRVRPSHGFGTFIVGRSRSYTRRALRAPFLLVVWGIPVAPLGNWYLSSLSHTRDNVVKFNLIQREIFLYSKYS